MRLGRNFGPFGKYVVIRVKDGKGMSNTPGDENEAVVIMVRDKHAQEAFLAYANDCASDGDEETAREFRDLADRAGPASPYCKVPD